LAKSKQHLLCHLQPKYRPLIDLLKPKIILYQLSLFWIHITYLHTTPDALKLLLTPSAYDACCICNCLHFPLDCATIHVQAKWKAICAGDYFTFQNLQNMKKIHVLQLQPLRHNPWQQLCEFSSKNDIELESSLKDSHFFKGLTILLSP